MQFIMLEQKYLETLNSGNSLEALKVLQLELTPLNLNRARTHDLMLGQAPPPANGHAPSRAGVMERLQVTTNESEY